MSGLAGSRDRSSQRCHKLRSRGPAALHHLHHHRPDASGTSTSVVVGQRVPILAKLLNADLRSRSLVDARAVAAEVLTERQTSCGSRSNSCSLAMLAAMRRALRRAKVRASGAPEA